MGGIEWNDMMGVGRVVVRGPRMIMMMNDMRGGNESLPLRSRVGIRKIVGRKPRKPFSKDSNYPNLVYWT